MCDNHIVPRHWIVVLVRLTLGELKRFINEAVKDDCWGGSHPDEVYEQQQLMDDPAITKNSVYVPDDIKDSIKNYLEKMGLSRRKSK